MSQPASPSRPPAPNTLALAALGTARAAAPGRCGCCHELAALLHALAAPLCALQTVQATPLGRTEVRRLLGQALARLGEIWELGRQKAHGAAHVGPCTVCGHSPCRF